MLDSRLVRWSFLSGFIFVALWLISTAMIGQNEYLPQAEEIVNQYMHNYGRISIVGYLGTVSVFFLFFA